MSLISAGYSFDRIMLKFLERKYTSIVCKRANLSTKTKTHYDVLKIPTSATFSEIKSAYYMLSLQYHPDKNQSEEAKKIFQEISNAYEVLGTYKSRRLYDKTIMVQHSSDETLTRTSNTTINRFHKQAGEAPEKIYNFDEWTRQHYTKQREYQQERKKLYENYKETKAEKQKFEKDVWVVQLAALIAGAILIAGCLQNKDNDIPVKPPKSTKI